MSATPAALSAIPTELLGLRLAVLRSSRRSAALQIVGDQLQVRVPHHLDDERVAAILRQKRPWIRARVVERQRLPPPPRPRELVSGESFPYLGRHYRLRIEEGHPLGVRLAGGVLRATLRPSEPSALRQRRIRQYLQRWYRARALELLRAKAHRYAAPIGVTPAEVSVRQFRSRWGSCTNTGRVVFNTAIIKAPHAVVDYVVIHELCHLIHPNHSQAFWKLVGRHDPAFADHRQWLRLRGAALL